MGQVRRPPIHPNCRCTLIPYIELKDSKGNIIDIDAERPAANADFDELAKNSYNENARQRGLKRRWDDLSSATKLKYYYQAQKDYERDNPDKKAYEQVSGSLTFAQYFKNQSEEFKRSWLGAKRYQLYVDGALDENKIFAPDLGYTVSTPVLFKVSKSEAVAEEDLENLIREQKTKLTVHANNLQQTKRNKNEEYIRTNNQTLISVLRESSIERLLSISDVIQNIREREESEFIDGYKEFKKTKDAERFIKEKLDIDASYSKIPIDVVNIMNRELIRAKHMFGTCGIIERIIPDDGHFSENDFASYNRKTKTIRLRTDRGVIATQMIIKKLSKNWFSSKHEGHIYMHEIGHAILNYIENLLLDYANANPDYNRSESWNKLEKLLQRVHKKYFIFSDKGVEYVSEYAKTNFREMVAECVAQILSGKPSQFSKSIWKIISGVSQ